MSSRMPPKRTCNLCKTWNPNVKAWNKESNSNSFICRNKPISRFSADSSKTSTDKQCKNMRVRRSSSRLLAQSITDHNSCKIKSEIGLKTPKNCMNCSKVCYPKSLSYLKCQAPTQFRSYIHWCWTTNNVSSFSKLTQIKSKRSEGDLLSSWRSRLMPLGVWFANRRKSWIQQSVIKSKLLWLWNIKRRNECSHNNRKSQILCIKCVGTTLNLS